MAKHSDHLIQNLQTLGGQVVETASKKYVAVRFPQPILVEMGPKKSRMRLQDTYFVGRCGALRHGRIASESVTTTDTLRYMVLSLHTTTHTIKQDVPA